MTQNPLLAPITDLIDYAAITPEHIVPAIEELLGCARQAVEQAADPALPATWEAVIEPLDTASERLGRAWSVAGHLNAVVNTPVLREAYNAALPLMTEFSTWAGLHEGLYRQYQRLHAAPEFQTWPAVRRRVIELGLRDFRLSGVELQGQARERYAVISDKQAQAAQKFSENVLDSIDAWALFIDDESRLAGIPADALAALRQAAEDDEKPGWKLTLKMPCYVPVMQYAQDRGLRETLYRAYGTIASEHGKPELDNSARIEELLALRAEEATLLDFGSFAALRLQTRMANDAQQVTQFPRDLAARAKPFAQRDLDELKSFAATQLGMNDLQPWDVPFASERLRETRYDYSEDEVKRYFTEPRVINGLFDVIQTLFNVRLQEAPLSTWHPDVRGVRVESPDGETQGHLYLDMYARSGKQSGAWVDSERTRRRVAGQLQTPIAYLNCNFSRPNGDKAALLSHDDVITLFHETGHALLSEVDEPGVSAFASVEWDAIELPSQFMENFCWEWAVVQKLSAHVDTGEPLPRPLYDRMLAARNFQSGMQAVRQIEFALFDMLLHERANAMPIADVLDLLHTVRQEVAVLFPPEWHRQPHSFSHLFAGGYGAERDTLDAETGARFRREIFAVGGARPAADSFRDFRGREPSIDALLRHSGMSH